MYKDLSARIPDGINTHDLFLEAITQYLNKWNDDIIKDFIEIKETTESSIVYKLSYPHLLPQLEEAKQMIDYAKTLFDSNIPIINELSYAITSAINNHYVDDINNQTKPLSQLFGHFKSLIYNKFKITNELIAKFVTNEDFVNQSPNDIVTYITEFASIGILNINELDKEKLEIPMESAEVEEVEMDGKEY